MRDVSFQWFCFAQTVLFMRLWQHTVLRTNNIAYAALCRMWGCRFVGDWQYLFPDLSLVFRCLPAH